MKNTTIQQAIRMSLTIVICMLLGKIFNLNSTVYLALFPTILLTKVKKYSWMALVKTFLPTILAASAAVFVSEMFSDHPFVIWAVSLVYFDQLRKRADTPAKVGGLLMPTFNWILIVVFSQHTNSDMQVRIHEIMISIVITILVAKLMVYLFPLPKQSPPPQFKAVEVSYANRLASIVFIGGGLAFLMIVDIVSATFCLVPVISAATQITPQKFKQVVEHRATTQVSGCAIAVVFSVFLFNQQQVISYYGILLFALVFTMAYWILSAASAQQDTHADALLATLLPIQLYIGNTDIGLESTFLRAWELAVTLGILFMLHHLTQQRKNHVQTQH